MTCDSRTTPVDRCQATITPEEQLRIAMEALTDFIERKVEAEVT